MKGFSALPAHEDGFEQGRDCAVHVEGSDVAFDGNKRRRGHDQARCGALGVVAANRTPGCRFAEPVEMDAGTEHRAAGGGAHVVGVRGDDGERTGAQFPLLLLDAQQEFALGHNDQFVVIEKAGGFHVVKRPFATPKRVQTG